MTDPGERIRAADAERRLQLLIDSVRDYAIFMLDRSGHVATWNLGAQAIKGYARDEIVGKSLETFYTPEDRQRGLPAQLLGQARKIGRIENEGWRVRKDGSRFWADVVISAVLDANGELIGYSKVTRDLTERRQAELDRLANEQRFRLIIDSVRDYAIFMLDPEGNVATWNQGAQRLKGYTSNEIIGSHFSRFYTPEAQADGMPARELELATRDGRVEDEGWRVRKDGSQFWANVVITSLTDAHGTKVGFAKITRDLTERRSAELERLELARAQEVIRMRDEFLSIASHELRTPLMSLQLQFDSARHATKDPKIITKLDRAGRGVARLTELVETLLDVSRIATGKMTLAPRRVVLADVLADVIDRMQEAAEKAGSTITPTLDPSVAGHFDPLRIGQVATNLLVNALTYAAGTPIEITLQARGEEAVLRVDDRGPGIAPEHQERIFGRFERASDRRHYGGLGLGLFVAHEIATAHGGSIHAQNRDGGGASFEVRLPAGGVA